jgi:hypothetical protein
MRSSTNEREGSPQSEAVRRIMRLMGLPTRETNSSQASSSQGPAHRPTTSCRDKEEYRVLAVFHLLLFPGRIEGALPALPI